MGSRNETIIGGSREGSSLCPNCYANGVKELGPPMDPPEVWRWKPNLQRSMNKRFDSARIQQALVLESKQSGK